MFQLLIFKRALDEYDVLNYHFKTGPDNVPQELCCLDGRAQGAEGDDCQWQGQAGVVQAGHCYFYLSD